MRTLTTGVVLCVALSVSLTGCFDDNGDPIIIGAGTIQLGDPIEGLPQAQLDAFNRGKDLMVKRFTPSEGLGPLYNATSCEACHSTPVVGGSAPAYRNFYLAAFGNPASLAIPPNPSVVVPSYGTGNTFRIDGTRFRIPLTFFGAPVTQTQRNAPPMFGTGLFEFVTDATIIAMSDPDDMDGDGISGRTNTDTFGDLGRFGYKCQANNIEAFIRGAAFNQMGITTNPVQGSGAIVTLHAPGTGTQVGADPDDPTFDFDGVPDPESSELDFGDIVAFSRFLAPPQQKPFTAAAIRGEALFDQIGCAKCHVPSLPTTLLDEGGNPIEIKAYTDLLIHNMGPALADGISMGTPQPSTIDPNHTAEEFRTQPLWGVSHHAPFLHDGRADTLTQAIEMHAGEADAAQMAFMGLTQAQRDDIIAFLECL